VKKDLKDVCNRVTELEQSRDYDSERIEKVVREIIPSVKQSCEANSKTTSDRLLQIEVYQRQRNLIFDGIPEGDDEDPENLVRVLFREKLAIPAETADKIPFYAVHRLSQRKREDDRPRSKPRHRSLIVSFSQIKDRDCVLRHLKNLKDMEERITVKVDVPPVLRQERQRLEEKAYRLRQEEKKKTRVIVRGTSLLLQWFNEKKKFWETYRN
jgi:hypothetical protein